MRTLAGGSGGLGTVDVVELHEHLAAKVTDIESARKMQTRTRCRLFLWGRVRERTVGGAGAYILNLEALVSHSPISRDTSAHLSQEMSELLPRKVILSLENDVVAFDFLSDWTDSVARYIVGTAALLSGDVDYAEALFLEVQRRIGGGVGGSPAIKKLRERIPLRLSIIAEIRADVQYRRWLASRSTEEAVGLAHSVGVEALGESTRPGAANLQAISLFLNSRDVDGALRELEQVDGSHDPSWRVNRAFLYAYKGALADAVREYEQLEQLPPIADVISQVESFQFWILEVEPENTQIRLSLAYFLWRVKGDPELAMEQIELYLSSDRASREASERELAETWLRQIQAGRG